MVFDRKFENKVPFITIDGNKFYYRGKSVDLTNSLSKYLTLGVSSDDIKYLTYVYLVGDQFFIHEESISPMTKH